ncbi:hypothetical protein Dimus_004821 [Dionaea muscipula]
MFHLNLSHAASCYVNQKQEMQCNKLQKKKRRGGGGGGGYFCDALLTVEHFNSLDCIINFFFFFLLHCFVSHGMYIYRGWGILNEVVNEMRWRGCLMVNVNLEASRAEETSVHIRVISSLSAFQFIAFVDLRKIGVRILEGDLLLDVQVIDR